MEVIEYTCSYKYRIHKEFEIILEGCPYILNLANGSKVKMPFAYIEKRGGLYFLTLMRYFGWDGATSAIDTKNFRRGSACHDALLELIGLGLLPADPWKAWADNFLIKLCKEDGMWFPRRKWVYRAVRMLGDPEGSKPRKVYVAP